MEELHTYRFESLDGNKYRVSVDGLPFISRIEFESNVLTFVQLRANGGCDTTRPDEVVNEWDFVRYGTISFGEQIVSTDPPAGVLDETFYSNLDRFTVTFDAANYVYIDDITVEVIPPTGSTATFSTATINRDATPNRDATVRERSDGNEGKESASYTLQEAIALRDRLGLQGPISSRSTNLSTISSAASGLPVVIATRRRENDEPDTVEIVLDRPMPVGQITRFTFDDGTTTNVVDYAIGLPDSDGDGVTDSLDQCPGEDDRIDANNNGIPDCLEPPIPAIGHWGLLILALLLLATGAMTVRRGRMAK